jgi:menaquinone-dependent protoporphyrinogen oxidase
MKVLVAVASKHGATAEIAAEIATEVREELAAGDPAATVELRSAEQVRSVVGYGAVVLGSAVYMGHWLAAATELAGTHASALAAVPVWLFSSGPIGDPPRPEQEAVDVTEIVGSVAAREHRVFAGRLDKHQLGFAERAVVAAVRAPDGDFRDWPAIRAWARGIAQTLTAEADSAAAR